MSQEASKHRKPYIVVTKTDFKRLWRLAEAHELRDQEVAQELMAELDRARVVEDRRIAEGVIRMGSTVSYESDHGVRTVTLVFPGEADIAGGRISILTPVGAALLGLSAGQSIVWTARDGKAHSLRVDAVHQGELHTRA